MLPLPKLRMLLTDDKPKKARRRHLGKGPGKGPAKSSSKGPGKRRAASSARTDSKMNPKAAARPRRDKRQGEDGPPPAATPDPQMGAGPELLSGGHVVVEALRAGRRELRKLWVLQGSRGPHVRKARKLAEQRKLPVQEASREEFESRVGLEAKHQGLALEAGALPTVSLEELLASGEVSLLVALDGVEDPHNVGAVMRVAEAAGAQGVLMSERRAAPLSSTVARASAGALEHLPVVRPSNMARALASLKQKGFWILGADSEQGENLFDLSDRSLSGKIVLVLGAEGKGLRVGIQKQLDIQMQIPMAGAVSSLNVSTAAAVCLFELRRRTLATSTK